MAKTMHHSIFFVPNKAIKIQNHASTFEKVSSKQTRAPRGEQKFELNCHYIYTC